MHVYMCARLRKSQADARKKLEQEASVSSFFPTIIGVLFREGQHVAPLFMSTPCCGLLFAASRI